MFLAKKIMVANILVGGAVLATFSTAALAYALTNPNCINRLKDCGDKMRDCKDRMCNRSSDVNGAEGAQKGFKRAVNWKI